MQKESIYAFRERLVTSKFPIEKDLEKSFGEEYLSLEKGVVRCIALDKKAR